MPYAAQCVVSLVSPQAHSILRALIYSDYHDICALPISRSRYLDEVGLFWLGPYMNVDGMAEAP